MKKCNKCYEEKPVEDFVKNRNTCKKCNREYHRLYRSKNPCVFRDRDRKRPRRGSYAEVKEYREKYPNKYKAHMAVSVAIKNRTLEKGICECGSKDVVAHHDDYLKPLDVTWFCMPCHNKWHKENGEGLNAK